MRVAILSPYPAFPFTRELGLKATTYENNATWTVTLAKHLAALPDTEIHVITETDGLAATRTLVADCVQVHFLRGPARFKTLTFWQLDRLRLHAILDKICPDIVHGQGIENQYGYAALTCRFPHLITIHGLASLSTIARGESGLGRSSILEWFERRCLRLATNIVVINPFISEHLHLGNRGYRLFNISNPVNELFFTSTTISREPNLIFATGWVDRLKGHDILLEALAILRRRGQVVRTIIAGPTAPTPYFANLQKLIQTEQLDVTFTGFLPPARVADWIRRCTILVHPSRHDNSPMSIAEALACGTPVLASRVGGIPHLIQDSETGLLFEPENSDELSEKIQLLLNDQALRDRLSVNARQQARLRFHPDHIARATRTAYEQILQKQLQPLAQPSDSPRKLSRSGRSQKMLIKRLASLIPISGRQSPIYWGYRLFLHRAQFWPKEKIEAWQLAHLRRLIRYAIDNTSGYRELYRKAGIGPDDVQTLEDLRHLPMTNKQLFQDHLEEFSVRKIGRQYVTTGGSTGIPFGFYLPFSSEAIEQAYIHTMWMKMGWRWGVTNAVLRGGFIGTPANPCQYDPFRRELNLSSYQLTANTLPQYLDALRHWNAQILQAYPSALHLLCNLMKETGQQAKPPLKLILLGSENIHDWQLDLFAEVFPGAKLFAWYGHAEKAILAPWCEFSRRYHAWPFYGITETLSDNREPAPLGSEGELVGTSFLNFTTPFIRYQTLDRAVVGAPHCSDCHRNFQTLEKVIGRSHEMIVTGQGRYISMTAINMHDRTFDCLRQFQFLQETPGRVEFQYIPKTPLTDEQTNELRRILTPKLGPDTELTLTQVSEIPRTKAGKYRFLDQRLPIKYNDRQ